MLASLASDLSRELKGVERSDANHLLGVAHTGLFRVGHPTSLPFFSATPTLGPASFASDAFPSLRFVSASGQGTSGASNAQQGWVGRRVVAEEGRGQLDDGAGVRWACDIHRHDFYRWLSYLKKFFVDLSLRQKASDSSDRAA